MDWAFLRRTAYTGLLSGGVAMAAFLYGLTYKDLETARTYAFTVLVFSELLRSFGARSSTLFVWELGIFSNLKLLAVVVGSIAIQLASHHLDWLGGLLHTTSLSWMESLALLALGTIPLLSLELAKLPRRWRSAASSV